MQLRAVRPLEWFLTNRAQARGERGKGEVGQSLLHFSAGQNDLLVRSLARVKG